MIEPTDSGIENKAVRPGVLHGPGDVRCETCGRKLIFTASLPLPTVCPACGGKCVPIKKD